jgi:hypothetical protein
MCSGDFLLAESEHRKLSMVTCYDYTFARLLSGSAIDAILVGDRAAMVMHGHPSDAFHEYRTDAFSHRGSGPWRRGQIRGGR